MKMRKLGIYSALLAAVMILSAGCNAKKATPENLLVDMAKNLDGIKSVSADMMMDAGMSSSEGSMGIKLDMEMQSTKKPVASHMKGKVSIQFGAADIGTDLEVYQVKESDDMISYTLSNDEWTKETVEEDGEELLNEDMFEDFKKTAESFKLEEETTEQNGKDCFELNGKIMGEVLDGILNEDMMESFSGGMDFDADTLKGVEIPCTLLIYKDDILPAKMSFDMKDVMNQLLGDNDTGMSVENCEMEITYNEFDKVDEIKVPKDVKEAAKGVSADDVDDTDDDDSKKAVKPAEQSKELLDNWDSYTVQINDKVLTLPCTMADIEEAGLTFDSEYTAADTAVEGNQYILAYYEDAAGNEVMVDMMNPSDDTKPITECVVAGVSVDDYGLEEGGLTVIFPGGIKIGDSLDTVLGKYGESNDVYEGDSLHMYTWNEEGTTFNSCEIDLDAETGKVCQMSMDRYE